MSTIADLSPDVIFNLSGRSDLQIRTYAWLRDAYREIGSNYPLETLEDSDSSLTVAGTDQYDYPALARAIKTLTLVMSQGQTIPLQPRSMRVIDYYPGPASNMYGTPCIWAPFGASYFLRPVPNGSYTVLSRFWKKVEIAGTIEDTIVNVPDDWLEVVTLAATIRGHIALNERDKADQIRTLLHGDPRDQAGNPGLIKSKLRRAQAEAGFGDWSVNPKVRSYT